MVMMKAPSLETSSSSAARVCHIRFPVYTILLALITGALTLVTIGAVSTTLSATDQSLRHAALQRSFMVSEDIAALVVQQLQAAESTSYLLSQLLQHSVMDRLSYPEQLKHFLLYLVHSHRHDIRGLVLLEPSRDPSIAMTTSACIMPGSNGLYMLFSTNRTTLENCAWAIDPVTLRTLSKLFCGYVQTAVIPFWGEDIHTAINGSWSLVFPSGPVDIAISFRVSIFQETGEWIGYTSADLDVGGLSSVLPATESQDGITFLVERSTSKFLRCTAQNLTTTYLTGDGFHMPLNVSQVDHWMVREADRAVRSRFGSWATAERATFWVTSDLIASVQPIERKGLSWISVSVTRPQNTGVQWVTIVVAVAIWLAGAAIAGLVSLLISVPVRNLSKDMASLCELKFRGLQTRRSGGSRVSEMWAMQESFLSLRSAVQALSKYIPPTVVRSIMQSHTGEVERYMKTKYLAIMFTDLQGFTTLSESVQLGTLNHVLNTWFEELGQVIENNGGTIDKFIGDAILVLFGAPDEVNDPAAAACQTAIDMISAMDGVNKLTAKLQLAPLKFRIGAHCGPVLVGNIGSHSRINYTVCGNSVNVASRMEQLGKEYGATPLVSGAIAQKVSDKYVCVFLDIVTLRGKTSLTRVYHLACPSSTASAEVLVVQQRFNDIHQCVMNGKTDDALAIVSDCLDHPAFTCYCQALEVLMRRIKSGEINSSIYTASEVSLDP
eukprot:m51a1_g8359 putative adenylate cyclase (722) ;mRNA; r:79761-82068